MQRAASEQNGYIAQAAFLEELSGRKLWDFILDPLYFVFFGFPLPLDHWQQQQKSDLVLAIRPPVH